MSDAPEPLAYEPPRRRPPAPPPGPIVNLLFWFTLALAILLIALLSASWIHHVLTHEPRRPRG